MCNSEIRNVRNRAKPEVGRKSKKVSVYEIETRQQHYFYLIEILLPGIMGKSIHCMIFVWCHKSSVSKNKPQTNAFRITNWVCKIRENDVNFT